MLEPASPLPELHTPPSLPTSLARDRYHSQRLPHRRRLCCCPRLCRQQRLHRQLLCHYPYQRHHCCHRRRRREHNTKQAGTYVDIAGSIIIKNIFFIAGFVILNNSLFICYICLPSSTFVR
jgi:hypothetical protein